MSKFELPFWYKTLLILFIHSKKIIFADEYVEA